ncbi:TPA: glycosyltransferase, partial [Escherichia coli]|nr:glycosyltransferase [Escherichia coli]
MLRMNKFITITVISYNSSATISDTLNSILQQTYNKKNIEVIISDDASKDNTLLIANDWKD